MSSKETNNTEPGEGFFKTLLKPHNVKMWGSGIAVLLIMAFVSESSRDGSILAVSVISLKTVVTELGFALLIAAIISVSIEEVNRRRFHAEVDSRISDVQKDVFRSTYSRNLPPLFFNEVDEILFRSKFFHSNYRIEYDFGEPRLLSETSTTYVMDVNITHIFTTRNITGLASEHCIRLQIHESPFLTDTIYPKIVSAYLYGHRTLNDEEIQKINNEAVSEGGSRTFQIQTKKVPPSEDIVVTIGLKSIKHADGFEFCRCSTPSNGLTVFAKFPPVIAHDRVGCDTAHRTPCKSTLLGDEGNKFSWVIEGAVLSSQGINFWWACDLEKMPEIKVNQ